MKLVTYRFENTQRVGVLTQDETAVLPLDYSDMNTLIETASPADLRSAASAAERARRPGAPGRGGVAGPHPPPPPGHLVPGHELQGPRR